MELNWNKYTPGENTMIITTLDTHTAGEPLRIVTGGMPELPGATILERRRYMQEHYDHIRKALMWEPRGPTASSRPPERLRRLFSDDSSHHLLGTL